MPSRVRKFTASEEHEFRALAGPSPTFSRRGSVQAAPCFRCGGIFCRRSHLPIRAGQAPRRRSSLLLLLLFAEHNGPVDAKKITPVQRAALLQAGSLLHTNRAGEFFLYGGPRVTAGNEHEAPVLCAPVEVCPLPWPRGDEATDSRSCAFRWSESRHCNSHLRKRLPGSPTGLSHSFAAHSHPTASKVPIRLTDT